MVQTKRPEIDPEIRDLFPPLSEEENQKLEAKLQVEGCLKPVIVWREKNIVLDGHHSLVIYAKHGIPYTVEYMSFPTRQAAIEWVIDNQLGRRNLTDERRAYFRGKRYLNHKQSALSEET